MSWLVDASQARHSGALTDYLGLLPALDAECEREGETCAFLLSAALAQRLPGLGKAEIDTPGMLDGVGRLALNLPLRRSVRRRRPRAILLGQYAPPAVPVPYVIRMTDAHLVDPEGLARVLPFYTPLQRLRWRARLASFRRSVAGASAVLCATEAVREQLLAAEPDVDAERVRTSAFGPPPTLRDVRHDGPRSRRLLTMHASPRKNVEAILEALARPELEGWTLSVLADLDDPGTPYARHLAGRIRELGLESRIRSLGYIRDPEELVRCMLDHDIFVTPSRIESWSHTVVEALAMRMPVIASDIACHREVSGGAAWLVPPDDVDGLAASILEISSGGPMVRERLDRGLETVRGYSWSRHAGAALDALRFAASDPR